MNGLDLEGALRVKRREPDFGLIADIASHGPGLVDLWEASPFLLETSTPRTMEIIDTLFPGNALLCCGWSRHRFDTRSKSRWYKLHDLEFVVPNPMVAERGITRNGNKSAHALSNTGPRRFLVIEFDFDAARTAAETQLLAEL